MTPRAFVFALSLTGLSISQNPTHPLRPVSVPVYQEGSVWVLESARLREGATERYLDQLADEWRTRLDLARGEGLVLSYKIFLGVAADRHDWDLMTLIELRNMAAIDGLRERLGALQVAPRGGADPETLREIVGTKIVREVLLRPVR